MGKARLPALDGLGSGFEAAVAASPCLSRVLQVMPPSYPEDCASHTRTSRVPSSGSRLLRGNVFKVQLFFSHV